MSVRAEAGIDFIADMLNMHVQRAKTTVLLETMAGKGNGSWPQF